MSDDTTLNGDFICSEAAHVVTCTGGTLDGTANLIPDDPATGGINEDVPATRTISIVVRAPEADNITITNQAFIDPTNAIAESNETNNQASENTNIESPYNLTLEKEGPNQASQNSEEDYVITVTNEGDAVNDVVVIDALPVGLIPLSITAGGNFICDLTENPVNGVRCVGDLAAGAEVEIMIHVFITQDGGTIDNEACVDPDNEVIESDEGDNCDTKSTPVVVLSPNLGAEERSELGRCRRDHHVHGHGLQHRQCQPAEPVTITNELPDSVSIVGTPVATNGFTCTHDGAADGGDVTCTDPTDGNTIGLAVGASTTITIQATVSNDADTAFTNTASVPTGTAFDAGSCPGTCENETSANDDNNSDSVTTSVSGSAIDLIMGDITDVFNPNRVSDSLTYTIM